MTERVPAVIVAGGRSTRIGGGEKCLLPLGGSTVLAHVVAVLRPYVDDILINSNSAPHLFADAGLEVRPDAVPGRLGPLAGIHTAMLWAREHGASSVLTVPADTPFLPSDLVSRLIAARVEDRPVIAASAGKLHPIVGIWPTAFADRLQDDLGAGARRVRDWLDSSTFAVTPFESDGGDPFWNINTPDDYQAARARAQHTP